MEVKRINREQSIFDSIVDYAIIVMDLDGIVIGWNVGAERILGWTSAEMIGKTANVFFTEEDRSAGRPEAEMLIALNEGRASDERWHLKKGGTRFWASGKMMPLHENGAIVGFVKVVADRTLEHQAGMELRRAEERYRLLFNSIDEGFCVIEVLFDHDKPVDFRFVEVNDAFERQTGMKDVHDLTMRTLAPNHEHYWFEIFGRVAVTGEPCRFTKAAAEFSVEGYDVYAFPVGEQAPWHVGVLFNNVSERIELENRRQILNQELSHRLKNTFAIVYSIINQTLRSASDIGSDREALLSRLSALSQAHDILISERKQGANLRQILAEAFGIVTGDTERVRFSGPDILIAPKAALTLTLLFHELLTNAVKYGSLSVPDGHVEVTWVVRKEVEADEPRLICYWSEFGGPPAVEPMHQGFGNRLIRMGLSGSSASLSELSYKEEGLKARFSAPLGELQKKEDT